MSTLCSLSLVFCLLHVLPKCEQSQLLQVILYFILSLLLHTSFLCFTISFIIFSVLHTIIRPKILASVQYACKIRTGKQTHMHTEQGAKTFRSNDNVQHGGENVTHTKEVHNDDSIMHKIPYTRCDCSHIGKTYRRQITTLREHKADITYNRTINALVNHIKERTSTLEGSS